MNSPASLAGAAGLPPDGPTYYYSAYGLRVRTPIPLTIPELSGESTCDIDVLEGDSAFFEESLRHLTLSPDRVQAYRLPERWLYARIEGMFDFLIDPDGARIFYRPLGEFFTISFETYLLGILMKAVLIKRGGQWLHASSVIVDGKAVAFLGPGGFGKSSLAACFVSVGYSLLTDDVLCLEENGGRIWAYPGPARLKLLPEDARRWLDRSDAGAPMDPTGDKCVFPLTAAQQCQTLAPVAALYCVVGPEKIQEAQGISIDALTPREALPEILHGTHTDKIVDADRRTHRLDAAQRIATSVPVRRLSYPRVLAMLPDVRDAILADLRSCIEPGGGR